MGTMMIGQVDKASAFNGITDRDMRYALVKIGEHEYTVPEKVAQAIEGYSEALAKERIVHADKISRLQDLNEEKYDEIAWGIMMNLESAANRDSLLAKSINDYEVDPRTGREEFKFRKELLRRIKAGLAGLTPDGVPRNK